MITYLQQKMLHITWHESCNVVLVIKSGLLLWLAMCWCGLLVTLSNNVEHNNVRDNDIKHDNVKYILIAAAVKGSREQKIEHFSCIQGNE